MSDSILAALMASLSSVPGRLDAFGGDIRVRARVPAHSLTTIRSGTLVPLVCEVRSVAALVQALALIEEYGGAGNFRVLGFGSNVLLPDSALGYPLIRLSGEFDTILVGEGEEIRVGAGASLVKVARTAAHHGLSGLEFAGGIPGSIGGAVAMNAGAHGGEISQVVRSVSVLVGEGSSWMVRDYLTSEIPWCYRRAALPGDARRSIVIGVTFALHRGDRLEIEASFNQFLEYRKRTQPLSVPSAGSVYKNPSSERPAGLIIDELGLKGWAVGGAQISSLHANWIVNERRRASSRDVVTLMEKIEGEVARRAGISLEREIQVW